MEFAEVGNGGKWKRTSGSRLLYAPTPPLPRHVCLHVTDASPSLPRYTPRHPRIRTEYSTALPAIPYSEAVSANLDRPCVFQLNVVRQGGTPEHRRYHNRENETPEESGLFRYSFIDGKTERIQRLPQEWDDEKCTWLVPQPTVAPIQVICTLILNTSQTDYYLSLINSINHLLYDRIKLTEQYNNVVTP
jgi:hypothetical protein